MNSTRQVLSSAVILILLSSATYAQTNNETLGIGKKESLVDTPMLTKTSGGGFMMPEWVQIERCALYEDHVIITHQFGSGANKLVKEEIRNFTITSGFLDQMILNSLTESIIETENYMCDGPGTYTEAHYQLSTGKVESIPLFSTGGCGSPQNEREGVNSRHLRQLIDEYCPTTHRAF